MPLTCSTSTNVQEATCHAKRGALLGNAGAGDVAKAAEVAGRLVRAYGELRQVELLLHSLAAALGSSTCAPAATRVIDSTAFKAALHQVSPWPLISLSRDSPSQ